MNNYNSRREEILMHKSKQKLSRNIKKKIETTMIGALSSVEKHFSFLWDNENISEEKRNQMKAIFNEMRSEILDKGNSQARNVDAELANYDIYMHKDYYDVSFLVTKPKED